MFPCYFVSFDKNRTNNCQNIKLWVSNRYYFNKSQPKFSVLSCCVLELLDLNVRSTSMWFSKKVHVQSLLASSWAWNFFPSPKITGKAHCFHDNIYIYNAPPASVRFEHSVCHRPLITNYDHIFWNFGLIYFDI